MDLFAQYNDYNYGYETPDVASNVDPAITTAMLSGFIFVFLIITIISYVVGAILLGRIFKKAGVESWKAWVPIYNTWVMLQIGGQQGFWSILLLITVINIAAIVFMYIAMYEIGLKLGKSGAFVVLAIFLPLVWMIWLAFDDSKWHGKKVAATNPAPAKK
jgi:hypothetical protein